MFHKLQNVLPPWTPHSPEGERNNYFETSEKSHLATRLHMPEELKRHRQWGEGLKNRFFFVTRVPPVGQGLRLLLLLDYNQTYHIR